MHVSTYTLSIHYDGIRRKASSTQPPAPPRPALTRIRRRRRRRPARKQRRVRANRFFAKTFIGT